MDEKTKHIVASNLALATLAKKRQKGKTSPKEFSVMDCYNHFLNVLETDQNVTQHHQRKKEKLEKRFA